MSKIEQLKIEIEKALFNPPEPKQMLSELRMQDVHLKQKDGDIELFKAINLNLVERVWKTMKIAEIMTDNATELQALGLTGQQLMQYAQRLSDRVGSPNQGLQNNPIEGFAKEGFLELEVFKKKSKRQN